MHDLAEADYMSGMKYKDIAEKYGVSLSTVKSWKTRYKWDRKGTHTKKKKVCKPKKQSTQAKKEKQKEITKLMQAVDRNKDLTEKQKLFCLYYVKSFNATQSYLKAYESNYNVANAEGYKLLVVPCIKKEIQRLKDIKRQSLLVGEEDIVEKYMRIAFSDITDFAEFGSEAVPQVDESGNMLIDEFGNIKTWKRNFMDFKNSRHIDGDLISEISLGKSGMKIKLEDKMKALEWLSNYFNMNPMNRHKEQYDNAMLVLKEKQIENQAW